MLNIPHPPYSMLGYNRTITSKNINVLINIGPGAGGGRKRRGKKSILPNIFDDDCRYVKGVPFVNSRGEGKSKWEEKYGMKKSKERRKEPLGTMFYQTSSKRSPPFCLLIGQKNTKIFCHQSEARTAATVWNWSGKTLSPGALLTVLYFSSCHIFHPFRLFFALTICPWVSEDV